MPLPQKSYRSHDYKFLVQRWRKICNESGLRMKKILGLDDYPCFEVFSPSFDSKNVIYLSAGIHGDESGAAEGLLAWASTHAILGNVEESKNLVKYAIKIDAKYKLEFVEDSAFDGVWESL